MTEPSNPLWGFSIPTTPTQKNYRPTHRVQWHKGAMAWDMSYMSTIGIFGKENIVQNILKDIGLTQESLWAERGGRWRAGVVHWSGNLSRKVKNATQPIGPATIIWNPSEATESSEADKPPRQLLIRIHPSAFSETFNELLRLVKAYKPRPYIQDLRHEIGSIDVTGPDATEALLGVLKPYDSSSKDWHASSFEGLVGLRDPASLLLGALLAFSIVDPRLKYPPRKVPPPDPETDYLSQRRLLESIAVFRKERASSPYQLLTATSASKPRNCPLRDLSTVVAAMTGPGTPLEPSSADPPIPIMLLASRNGDESWIQDPGRSFFRGSVSYLCGIA
ncbi:hypothetical protein F4808DRAFT_70858 [Astrocystis sublimbata]|nr:hypothetical protein F4808DRAFT_70858 [Astrocystis sublimbata]